MSDNSLLTVVNANSANGPEEGSAYSRLQRFFLENPRSMPKTACLSLHLNYYRFGDTARQVKWNLRHNKRLGLLTGNGGSPYGP